MIEINGVGHYRHRPVVHQGTGAHAISQPLAGADNLQRPAPVFAFALPGVAVEIEAAFMGRAVVAPIAIAPAVISGVVLGAAESPHVVQGPHDRLANTGDIANREHLPLHPVQVHHVSIGAVDALRPA